MLDPPPSTAAFAIPVAADAFHPVEIVSGWRWWLISGARCRLATAVDWLQLHAKAGPSEAVPRLSHDTRSISCGVRFSIAVCLASSSRVFFDARDHLAGRERVCRRSRRPCRREHYRGERPCNRAAYSPRHDRRRQTRCSPILVYRSALAVRVPCTGAGFIAFFIATAWRSAL